MLGDQFSWGAWSFEVIEMDRWRIAKVRATALFTQPLEDEL